MAIFAVIGLGDATALAGKIENNFPDDYYAIERDKWFLVADGVTAKNITERLGINKTGGIRGIVITVGGYNGFASGDMWEWLRVKKG